MLDTRANEKFLIGLLDKLLSSEGSQWAVEDIAAILSKHIPKNDLGSYSLFQKIDRHCIEEVCKSQAKQLYAFFPDAGIRKQLEEDFLAMEYERRRDNFSNFSLHCYQQIECLTNFLFDSNWIKDAYQKFSRKQAYIARQFAKVDPITKIETPEIKYRVGATISKAILYNANSSDKIDSTGRPTLGPNPRQPAWSAKEKYRLVSYFGVFNAEVTTDEFSSSNRLMERIYEARNTNHRPVLSQWSENLQVDSLEFYGGLAAFIKGISRNISKFHIGLHDLPYDNVQRPRPLGQ